MGKLFDKFSSGLLDKFLSQKKETIDKFDAGIDFVAHSIPWVVGFSFFVGGVYGLGSFLAIDFSKKFVENLKKNEMLSDAQKDFYTVLGDKVFDKSKGEAEYEKMKNKKFGNISDENSLLARWNSIYNK